MESVLVPRVAIFKNDHKWWLRSTADLFNFSVLEAEVKSQSIMTEHHAGSEGARFQCLCESAWATIENSTD